MTEEQSTWLTAFADEMAKRVKNFKEGDDICSRQVLNALRQIEKYMQRYPNPRDAARAMSYTARINHGRDEAIQRGEGVRHTRIVGQFPTRNTDHGDEVIIDFVDRNAIDPAMQVADRDECRRAVRQLRPVVAAGIALTAVFGYDQGEAAKRMGVGRTHISRAMNQSEREMRDDRKDAA